MILATINPLEKIPLIFFWANELSEEFEAISLNNYDM